MVQPTESRDGDMEIRRGIGVTDHPYTDPGDGRTRCETCGKYVWLVINSCKGVLIKRGDGNGDVEETTEASTS